MKRFINFLPKIVIPVLVYIVCSFLISEPKVTCIEAGGSFNENLQLCEGLKRSAEFHEIIRSETLFMIILSSVLTVTLLELANIAFHKSSKK